MIVILILILPPPPPCLPCCHLPPRSMKPGQKSIYYMAGDSVEAARAAPFVEKLVASGTEVLYLTEAVDEAAITNLAKFGEFELVDVSKEGVSVEGEAEEDKAAAEVAAKELSGVVEFLKKALGERVEKVSVSNRLVDSPCAVVTSKFGWSANMERIMRSQAMGDSRAMDYMKGRKIMEINPNHDIIKVRVCGAGGGERGHAVRACGAAVEGGREVCVEHSVWSGAACGGSLRLLSAPQHSTAEAPLPRHACACTRACVRACTLCAHPPILSTCSCTYYTCRA